MKCVSKVSVVLVLVLAITGACGGPHKETETLTESIRAFNEGMRWQRFAVAANAIPPEERGAFVDEMDERADDLKITDYEIVRVETPSKKEARVHIKVSWYLDSEGTLHETHAIQTWESRNQRWWMVDASRLRGDEMPGLTEPATEPTKPGSPDEPGEPPPPGAEAEPVASGR